MQSATLRQNGLKMVTVRVSHHLSFYDVVYACIRYLERESGQRLTPQNVGSIIIDNLDLKDFESRFRHNLEEIGYAMSTEPEHSYDPDGEVIKQVGLIIRGNFPGWRN